jgi:hypothetical protein
MWRLSYKKAQRSNVSKDEDQANPTSDFASLLLCSFACPSGQAGRETPTSKLNSSRRYFGNLSPLNNLDDWKVV